MVPPTVHSGPPNGTRTCCPGGGLARELCIDIRLVKRWRKGAKPDSANLIALFSLAARIGLLHLLLPEVSNCQVKEDCPKKQT